MTRDYAQNPMPQHATALWGEQTAQACAMAFHEKAGPGQVDFDLPFLKFPFPSWREGVQSGPERSRARSLRRSEPLTARTDLSPFRQEGKGAVARMFFFPFLSSCSAPKPTLSPPFHPHSW